MPEESFADQLVSLLKSWRSYENQIVSLHTQPKRSAIFGSLEESLQTILPKGFNQLYLHQTQALALAKQGLHLTLATATASGKTLALSLPARHTHRLQPKATLLCIAPTKALVEQWVEQLHVWYPDTIVASYTGDTPKHLRQKVREKAQYLVTTPDMLHVAILSYHAGWRRFFRELSQVIIDESHIYCGAFGSHMALILRRLQRVALFYRRESPTLLFASATIGNPEDHASLLSGKTVQAVTENGAPTGGRHILLWRPADSQGHSDEAATLMAFFLQHQIRCILFGQARQSVERMCRTVQGHLPDHLQNQVIAYRAGYLAQERQEMQRQLTDGELLGVVCTNALELGINIGHLDVSILDGFPGSIASFWQQAGRAGRGSRSALTILVLREDALDEYFAEHPEKLLERPSEHALINFQNPYILPRHLHCAAWEGELTPRDLEYFGPQAKETVIGLVEQGILREHHGGYISTNRTNSPAFDVPLRQIGQRLTMVSQGRVLEETDQFHLITECFPGAIYLSQGRSYLVQKIDEAQGMIYLIPKEVPYYTEALTTTDVYILCSDEHRSRTSGQFYTGDVQVVRQTNAFLKLHPRFRTKLEKCHLETPLSFTLNTKAFWITIGPLIINDLILHHFDPAGSLHATEHALIALLPLFVLGDRRDVGGVSIVPEHEQTELPTIFIYDGIEGGIGYAEEAFRQFDALAQAVLERLLACTCTAGCLACVMSPKCGNDNRPLDKQGAIHLLRALLQKEEEVHVQYRKPF